jgi:methylmalonyl-CoA epimerase
MRTDASVDANIRVDHIAIAVRDLSAATAYFEDRLGFSVDERRETKGAETTMKSVVMKRGSVTFVLLEGEGRSQVSRFIDRYGPGVHHVALHVDGLTQIVEDLKVRGLMFSTGIVQNAALTQTFTARDENSAMMLELIERGENQGFDDGNVTALFRDLEQSDNI